MKSLEQTWIMVESLRELLAVTRKLLELEVEREIPEQERWIESEKQTLQRIDCIVEGSLSLQQGVHKQLEQCAKDLLQPTDDHDDRMSPAQRQYVEAVRQKVGDKLMTNLDLIKVYLRMSCIRMCCDHMRANSENPYHREGAKEDRRCSKALKMTIEEFERGVDLYNKISPSRMVKRGYIFASFLQYCKKLKV